MLGEEIAQVVNIPRERVTFDQSWAIALAIIFIFISIPLSILPFPFHTHLPLCPSPSPLLCPHALLESLQKPRSVLARERRRGMRELVPQRWIQLRPAEVSNVVPRTDVVPRARDGERVVEGFGAVEDVARDLAAGGVPGEAECVVVREALC